MPTSASKGIGDGIMLTGVVSSQAEAQQAYDIAARLLDAGTAETVGAGSKVVNAIVVRGRDQIMLKVTVAEVERDVIKQLGINLSGSLGYGTAVVNFNNTNPFTAYGQSLSGSSIAGTSKSITGDVAGDGAGRRHPHAGRAEPDGDLRRDRDLPGRRRIPDPQRLFLLGDLDAPARRRPASRRSNSRSSASVSTSRRSC